MSIKDLFGKTSSNLEETVQDVESVAFVEEKTKADQAYHPQIDFSDPENFVYYGSAELYYDAAIRRIYEDYPYDGSKAEQIEFKEKASALERWVFETKYPKTTGHIQLGTSGLLGAALGDYSSTTTDEYIKVWGGLHTDSSATNLSDHFESSARYDNDKNRNQNWNCDLSEGVTIEFWMKKDSYNFGVYDGEVILDLWNGQTGGNNSRIMLQLFAGSTTTAQFQISVESGADVTPLANLTTGFVDTTQWAHYAITLVETSTNIEARMYINGEEHNLATIASLSAPFSGKIDGFIGAMQRDAFSGTEGGLGAGKFQGYLDEFRFWKTKRTSRQIKLNWFNAVGGGANTDDATSDLGVYLKFNEGIVGNNAADSVVLDYSGRLANGAWVGYESTTLARSTDSAIESAGYTETPSPIIYKEHSSVSALISEMQTSGSVYDANRGESFYRSMPTWLQDEDNGNLRLFSQILGSYLDTLHVQIKELTELKTKRYPMEGVKASTMAADLLKDKGFMISNMFENNEVYEKLASVNLQDAQFETELHEIKNIIYTNIYNNLEKIYKTKGTEGSIRNLIRCYGIDDELIKLNLYTDGGTQYLTDKSRETSVKKKYVDFNDPTRFEASIYQVASLPSNPNSYIAASADASRNAFTMEADIVVPYKKEIDENGYFNTPFLSASIMGFHEAAANPADFTWGTENLSVYLVRDSLNSKHAKFVMRNIAGTIEKESDYIYDIYENEHYNVALRIKPQTYPYAGGVTATTPSYDIELYAVTTNFGEIENEVLLSTTVSNADGLALMNASKRVYAGAHVENYTGAVQQESDLQIGGIRAWFDYLENDEILQHNKDVLNYGMRSSIDGSNLYLVDDVQIPTQELSILNWDFDTVTTTDSSGEFVVEDITSGSTNTIYGTIDDIIRREHKAKGSDFPADSSLIISNEFIQAYKKQLPESAFDAQNIYIKGDQEINFSDDDDVSDNLFIMEKSPASLISEEMLKSFSTTLEFANLFMRPVERFRVEYKDLARARQLFFERVESDMDFDRFFEYFKWIDSSISTMVNQLVPMSANFSGGIVDVIEPHILERDKYQRQVGLLSTVTSTEASMRGAQELKYNWRVGHAPLSGDDNENCLWQKERKERSDDPTDPSEQIRQVLARQNNQEFTNPIILSGSDRTYDGRTYATRRLSKPYTVDIGFKHSIHGGINYSPTKNRVALAGLIPPGNANDATGAPENIVIVGAGSGPAVNLKPACIDENSPPETNKYKYDGFAVVGKHAALATQTPTSDSDHYAYRRKISHIFPGNIMSSSVNSGYSSLINKPAADGGLGEGYDLVNLHSDTTDVTNVIPIQGPFTQEHIGGRQSRHVHITTAIDPATGYITSSFDRPEFWNIYVGEFELDTATGQNVDDDGAIGISSPDYQVGVTPDTDSQKAYLFREERAKRPVNIKNIQTIIGEGAHGNFTYNYEVMSTFGDQGYYLRRADNLLPDAISQVLPETTNFATLVAQKTGVNGNLTTNEPGGATSNRFPSGNPATVVITTVNESTLSASDNKRFTLTDANGVTTTFRITGGAGKTAQNGNPYTPGTETEFGYDTLSTQDTVRDALILKINSGTNIAYTATADGLNVLVTQNNIGTVGNTSITFPNGAVALSFSGTDSFQNGSYGVNDKPSQDRTTGSANVIRTRFSAPGGPEINSPAYLDVATQQYSVHNSINYRNLTTRADNSGELGTIRSNTHQLWPTADNIGRREGLRTLRARHQGQFGIESQHGAISGTDYGSNAAWHKQHRNNQEKITPVDKIAKAVQVINNNTQHLQMTLNGAEGALGPSTTSMSFSFWYKADTNTAVSRNILQITDSVRIFLQTNTVTSREFLFVSLKDTGAVGYKTAHLQWRQVDLNKPITEWNLYVISFDFNSLATIEATIDGVSQSATTLSIGNFIGQFAGVSSGATFYIGDGLGLGNDLDGAIMNLSYFDSFITQSPSDLEVLINHREKDDITSINSLIGFWTLGEDSGLNTGDVIEDNHSFSAFYGSAKSSFLAVNPGNNADLLIGEGFYSYLAGERQGDQRFDNHHLNSLLPASDFGYSWIDSTLSGSDSAGVTWASKQRIVDFAPKNGVVATKTSGYVQAIVFPTISDIQCGCEDSNITISLTYDINTEADPDNKVTITSSTSLNVTLSDTATEGNIWQNDIESIYFAATYTGCCEDGLEYRITAENGAGRVEDTGYHSTPPAQTWNIDRDQDEAPGNIDLTFYVKDCEENVETLVVTLEKAEFDP